MKRLLLLSVCAMFSLAVAAQVQVKVPSFEGLQKDITKSNEDIANPKKEANPKTWITRAETLVGVYDKSIMGATQGMHKTIFATLTKSKKTETIGEKTYDVLIFPTLEMYFEETGGLACWKETKQVVEDPLLKAFDAYKKALELDTKGANTKKIGQGLEQLALKDRAEGINRYTLQDYKGAQQYFMAAIQAGMHPLVGKLDSLIAYYAGLMSLMDDVKDYDNAITYFTICADNSYYEEGDVQLRLAKAYEVKGDKAKQEQVLAEGFMKFPKNQGILIELINMYLSAGDDATKVLPYLHKAQENEPTNSTLLFAEATLYEKLGKMDDAERMYLKTIEVDPASYNAYYNLGALYYNKAVECIKQSNAIKDWKDPKIKELDAQAAVEFKKAIEPFIKAHELQPNDKYSLENVKNIYSRFRGESKEMDAKYKEYEAKLDALLNAAPAAQQ